MSSHGYGHYDLGGGFAQLLVLLLLVLLVVAVITIVLIVRSIVYIIVTFAKFRKHTTRLAKSFWVFALSLALCSVGIIYALSQPAHGQPAIVSILLTLLYLSPVIGYLQLLICCKVVRTEFSENVMKQNYDVMSDILRKDWWQSSEDRPLTQQQAA